ncbi:hypothetical protein [Helicobacter brantae]|uniref:hypothetical protein n=1 Tax=Helicobacter brantae TaxID=375927 RepID=UPI0011C0665D|nr:hypothetical protein [Helicobacter brantae]
MPRIVIGKITQSGGLKNKERGITNGAKMGKQLSSIPSFKALYITNLYTTAILYRSNSRARFKRISAKVVSVGLIIVFLLL